MNNGRQHTTEKLLEGERLSGKVTLFAKVTILPGDELPYHEHHGETEVYHILSGEGIYQDNNKTYPMQAGMTTFCEDGSGHAVSCSGKEPLVFLAMIQKKRNCCKNKLPHVNAAASASLFISE